MISRLHFPITCICLFLQSISAYPQNPADDLKSDSSFFQNLYKNDPDNWDVRLFRNMNSSRSNFKDAVIPVFDRSLLPMSYMMPFSFMGYGRAYKKYYEENTGFLMTGAEIMNFVLTIGTKIAVKRKRPYESLEYVYYRDVSISDPFSFPSGHSSMSFTVAGIMALRYPKYPYVYLPVYAWAFAIAYGRTYFGMHYPSDLLAGMVFGTVSSITIYSLRKNILNYKNKIFQEDYPDDGSIDGGALTIFTVNFIAASVLTQYVFPENRKYKISLSPSLKFGYGLDLRLSF